MAEPSINAHGKSTQSPNSMSPEQAIDLLRKIAESRDQSAFELLFQSYAPRVKAYMIRQGANPELAEDLAQDALGAVWQKARLYSPEKGNPSTWIFTIARNLRIDRLRRERPWQPLPEGHAEKPSDDLPPDEQVSEQERSEKVRAILAQLPEDQLAVVSLSFLEGYSHSEIAKHLDIPLGTVKSRMRLAYEKIRPLVEDLA